MDGFDFEDDLGSLAGSDNEPEYVPPPKKKVMKDMFSDDSDNGKPKTLIEKSTFHLTFFYQFSNVRVLSVLSWFNTSYR